MKKFIALILCLTSATVFADTFHYRLYEDSVEEFTPIVVSIEMNGAFKKGAVVKSVMIKEVYNGKTTLLFSFTGKSLQNSFDFSWNANNTLVVKSKAGIFKAKVKEEISYPWGDTIINPTDKYSFYTETAIILNEKGTLNEEEGRFEIGNITMEEACMFGVLRK